MTSLLAERGSLRKLARAHWVQTGYVGTDGKRHAASDDALMGVLGALGVPIGSPSQAPGLLAQTLVDEARSVMEPVLVDRGPGPLEVSARIAESSEPEATWVCLRTEGSPERRWRLSDLAARRVSHQSGDGRSASSWRFDVPSDGDELPPGYHLLELETPTERVSSIVVSSPGRCPQPERGWGTNVPLYALRSDSDWGAGSLSELGQLARMTRRHGASFVATLPLCSQFSDAALGDASPYMPASRLAWNEMYVDVESLPEVGSSPEASALLADPVLRANLVSLRRRTRCDPGSVTAAKCEVLRILAKTLREGRSPRRSAFEEYVRSRDELLPYARFRSVCDHRRTPWWRWPSDEQLALGRTAATGTRPGAGGDVLSRADDVALTHLYAQWVAEDQLAALRELGIGLHLDIPVGVHPAGFDPLWEPESFAAGASVGAPPDDFYPGGQVWGFPPLHPRGLREQGYRYVSSSLRHSMRWSSSVRVDHVMGLHRTYWVPDGLDASDGAYVRYCSDEMYAVLCLEAYMAGAAVVGEDLGTVPGSVRRAMDRNGLLRTFVFDLESSVRDPLPATPELCTASLATHDLPPFASYWLGLDIEERTNPGYGDEDDRDEEEALKLYAGRSAWRQAVLEQLRTGRPQEAQEDDAHCEAQSTCRAAFLGCVEHLGVSAARLVVLDLEDLWLETEPQNRPGTGPLAGNFVRRARRTVEELGDDPQVTEVLSSVGRARRASAEAGASQRHSDTRSRKAASGG